MVSAEALAYGAQLDEHASHELHGWADDFVAENLRWHDADLKLLDRSVDDAFSAYNPSTRNNVAFLVLYLAYHDQRKLEESFMQALRANADEAARLRQDLDRNRGSFGSVVVTIRRSPFAGSERENETALARIRELENRSNLQANQLREVRRRVDFYLRALHAARTQLLLAPAEVLASVQPADPS